MKTEGSKSACRSIGGSERDLRSDSTMRSRALKRPTSRRAAPPSPTPVPR